MTGSLKTRRRFSAANARARLLEVAEKIQGIDVKAYQSCVETSYTSQLIKQDVAAGAAHDVRGHPVFHQWGLDGGHKVP